MSAQPLQLVIPFPPGGVDVLAKILLAELQVQLGELVELAYRPGEGGAPGAASVAAANPDGRTLLFAPIGPVLLQPAYRQTDYRWDSFTPVCRLTGTPVAMLAAEDSPYRDFGELLADARRRPNALGYVHAGAGGIPHVAMAYLCKRYGVELRCVAREGAANAIKAVVAHDADVFAEQAPLAAARLPEGGLRAIAVLATQRLAAFPDAPTSAECGIDLLLSSWNAVMAPAGTPQATAERIAKAFERAMARPTVRTLMQERLRTGPAFLGPRDTAAFIGDEARRLQPLLADLWGREP